MRVIPDAARVKPASRPGTISCSDDDPAWRTIRNTGKDVRQRRPKGERMPDAAATRSLAVLIDADNTSVGGFLKERDFGGKPRF